MNTNIPHIYRQLNEKKKTFTVIPPLNQNTHLQILQFFKALPEYIERQEVIPQHLLENVDS